MIRPGHEDLASALVIGSLTVPLAASADVVKTADKADICHAVNLDLQRSAPAFTGDRGNSTVN